jgi:hypothetical protein
MIANFYGFMLPSTDGWIMFEMRDSNLKKTLVMAADPAIRAEIEDPTPGRTSCGSGKRG